MKLEDGTASYFYAIKDNHSKQVVAHRVESNEAKRDIRHSNSMVERLFLTLKSEIIHGERLVNHDYLVQITNTAIDVRKCVRYFPKAMIPNHYPSVKCCFLEWLRFNGFALILFKGGALCYSVSAAAGATCNAHK